MLVGVCEIFQIFRQITWFLGTKRNLSKLKDICHCTKNYIFQILEYPGKLKNQEYIIFPTIFWLKKRPYFLSPKSSKQELFKTLNKNLSVISK